MAEQLRVVVVGVGRFGALHVRAWQETGAQVVGVVDRDPSRAESVAATFTIPHHSPDAAALVAQLAPDCVVIASDEVTHSDLADLALTHGCHVFVEKPFALSLERARRTCELAQETGCSIVAGHISRFAQPYRHMKHRLDQGGIGDLWSMRLRRDFSRAWFLSFGDRVHPVWESCVHDIDLAVSFAQSRGARVFAMESTAAGEAAPSVVNALIQFSSGVTATIESAWNVPDTAPSTLAGALALEGSIVGEAELIASEGTLRQRLVSEALVEWGADGAAVPDLSLWPEEGDELGGALRAEIAYAREVFLGHRPNDVMPAEQALWGVEIAEGFLTSLHTRAPVDLGEEAPS